MVDLIFQFTNCLIVAPTYDAYLENGTDIGLTVGKFIVVYAGLPVNMRKIFLTIILEILEINHYMEDMTNMRNNRCCVNHFEI